MSKTVALLSQAIWPYSGHYHPTEENFQEFISFLQEHCVDLTNVKVDVLNIYAVLTTNLFTHAHFINKVRIYVRGGTEPRFLSSGEIYL